MWWLGLVLAAEPERTVSLGTGISPGITSEELGGGAQAWGRVMVHLPPLSVEVTGGEGLFSGPTRLTGNIVIGVRKYFGPGVFARVGFAHHHETTWPDFLAAPGGALAGSAPSIRHRSGVDIGAGWAWTVPGEALNGRLALEPGVTLRVLPDPQGPAVYGFLDLAWMVRVGPVRPAATVAAR